MRPGLFRSIVLAAGALTAVLIWSPSVSGQASKNRPVVAGCPSASAKFHPCALEKAKSFSPPRMPDGTPNLQGIWDAPLAMGFQNIEDYPGNPAPGGFGPAVSVIVDPADGKVPYFPWARAQRDENVAKYIDPYAQCLPTGVPRQMANFRTRQITQSGNMISIVNEAGGHIYRVVYMDGRPHLSPTFKLWMGDSLGRWDGNTLVIDVNNLNGYNWLDDSGNFYTDAAHLVERLTMIDRDTIHYEVRLEDPKAYTRPWTMVWALAREKEPGFELLEEACREGERDLGRLRETGLDYYFGDTWRGR